MSTPDLPQAAVEVAAAVHHKLNCSTCRLWPKEECAAPNDHDRAAVRKILVAVTPHLADDGAELAADATVFAERSRIFVAFRHATYGALDPQVRGAALDLLGAVLHEPPADPLPPRGPDGFREIACGNCGEEFGTNCDADDTKCPECEARRCPHCGSWFGAGNA